MTRLSGTTKRTEDRTSFGVIKWFGGNNGKTGQVNTYGFIATESGDVFFHQSQALAPVETLTPETQVVFNRILGKDGKGCAGSVRVLSRLSDDELVALLTAEEPLAAQDALAIALCRSELAPCEGQVLEAVAKLSASAPRSLILTAFWRKFSPSSPSDPFYKLAPDEVKGRVCKQHYAEFRAALAGLFKPLAEIRTTLDPEEVYRELDERDEQLARGWANGESDAALAKMLSARAAEKAVKRFYEAVGSSVEDVSIRQLDGISDDWRTHDLLVDAIHAIDVKNARRPVNERNFYVEHTVPRFKLDRRGDDVRIAGLLSPYLQLQFIRDPDKATFGVDDLVFLGEMSRRDVARLISMFASPAFEVTRVEERTVPHWVFGYPSAWYRPFTANVQRFTERLDWPEDDDWQYVLDKTEKQEAIPALCVAGKQLPAAISATLTDSQVVFYTKLQAVVGNPPELPAIFLLVLTDFLDRLRENDTHYSPSDYLPLLFADNPNRPAPAFYPVGAVDPLGLVRTLIDALNTLWQHRRTSNLTQFSNFRFSGLGILQARERHRRDWTTLVAYCGGSVYETDEAGKVRVHDDGRPVFEKGRCGHTPLVLGKERTCSVCGKLTCSKCQFCSLSCREERFREMAAAQRARSARKRPGEHVVPSDARWNELPPLEAYELDLRAGSYFARRDEHRPPRETLQNPSGQSVVVLRRRY